MRIIFKRVNGQKRWFLVTEDGRKIAKFYTAPTKEFANIFGNDFSHPIGEACSLYRARVNVRCDAKGIARVYA